MEKQVEEKSRRIEELLEGLKNERESEARLEESFRVEVAAGKKLADCYKETSEDQVKVIKGLESAVEELRRLLQEASEQYGCLEAAKNKLEEQLNDQLESANNTNKELKSELDKVNKLLEANTKKDPKGLSKLSPAANAASRLMSKGLTLSQLYGEYLTKSEKLNEAEEEIERLSRHINEVLKEIEERGPTLRKQREDLDRAQDTIVALQNQMQDSLAEIEKQRVIADEEQRRADYMARENERLSHQVKDLSQQVRVLLIQVETDRGGQSPGMNYTSPGRTSSSDFISKRLVSVSSVAELQDKNIKLLASVRELTAKIEDAEREAIEKHTLIYKKNLN